MRQDFAGKVAAITGAASGIGLECAKSLLKEGASVALVDRAEDSLKSLCAELGPNAFPVVVDLLNPESVATMMPQILASSASLISSMPMLALISAARWRKATPIPGTGCWI